MDVNSIDIENNDQKTHINDTADNNDNINLNDKSNDATTGSDTDIEQPNNDTESTEKSDNEEDMDDADTDDDDEDDDEDDDDEDENPPLLKYTRITKLPQNFFQRDSISACHFYDNIFLFGTHSGLLHITYPDFTTIRTLKCHRSSILSIDTDGSYFITGSIDGTVVIGSIENESDIIAFDFKRPINSVVLDNDYKNSKTFLSGGMAGDVILSQRNWLGNRVDTILIPKHSSKGSSSSSFSVLKQPILGIFKLNDVLIWINNEGIIFLDIPTRTTLLTLSLKDYLQTDGYDKEKDLPIDLFKPYVHHLENSRIIIGWCNNIWSFKVTSSNSNSRKKRHQTSRTSSSSSQPRLDNKRFNATTTNSNIGSILSSAASSFRGTPEQTVELEYHFKISMLLSGIASFKDDQVMCLGFDIIHSDFTEEKMEIKLKSLPPQLKIFDLTTSDEIYQDEIVCKNFQNLSLNDYHLGKFIPPNDDGGNPPQYFLISSSDAIKIQEFKLKDHYDWYIEKNEFGKAWDIGNYAVSPKERFQVGLKYIDKLIHSIAVSNPNKSAAMSVSTAAPTTHNTISEKISSIFEQAYNGSKEVNDEELNEFIKDNWSRIISKFLDFGKIDLIVNKVPQEPKLDTTIYDSILDYYLDNGNSLKGINEFIEILEKWSKYSCFSTNYFEEKLEHKIELHNELEISYRNAVILLYLHEQRYSKAIIHMIKTNDQRIFDILSTHNLLTQFLDQIINIILLPYFRNNIENDTSKINNLSNDEIEAVFSDSIQLIASNRNRISISKLIKRFQKFPNLSRILFVILRRLSKVDPQLITQYETELIGLYIKFDKPNLLQVLKTKSNYDIEKVIELCSKEENLYNELIFLWGKIGETKKALSLIIDELKDPNLAIDFVKSWGDSELWEFMIQYSWNKPAFITALLEYPDEYNETYIKVIKGMRNDVEIPSLSKTVGKITRENFLSLKVNKNIYQIVDDETTGYAIDFLKLTQKGKIFQNNDDDGIGL
ncbi:Vps41p NDAI_0A03560 [Naumovozyma dairenensis CBS 421]|uniref:Vacuolar protein sorting-associated protein 41 n=1 Tax=Naumovozyma dairenensis (strain ATCC 10597 / BCRC 20456 / CBS 421 / NBRC 0211 / NRRL Y-12639) TaxID=1071378 RepID=G0W3X5_NAUDC|nr:hypothetical protein NDAI_0A03560 [Naumovozyma dairenensis CBS 421]CCD22513.1 hypothetical protein NDAI_0A03560 [Naumovozyma dairenensis CBS 421]